MTQTSNLLNKHAFKAVSTTTHTKQISQTKNTDFQPVI